MDDYTDNSTLPVFDDFAPELSAEFLKDFADAPSPSFGRDERVRQKVLEALGESVKKHERMLNPPDYPEFFVEDTSTLFEGGVEPQVVSPEDGGENVPEAAHEDTSAEAVPNRGSAVPASVNSPETIEFPDFEPSAEDTEENVSDNISDNISDEPGVPEADGADLEASPPEAPPAEDRRYADSGKEIPPAVHRRTAEMTEKNTLSGWKESLSRFFATRAARKEARKLEASAWPDPEDKDGDCEPNPQHVFRHYYERIRSLKLRGRLGFVLLVIMLWISFGFPCTGLLGSSIGARASACLVLHLAILITTMDVFSAGILQLFHFMPAAESVVSLAMLCSTLDAFLVMRGGSSTALPVCAVCDFTAILALWSNRLTCVSRAMGAAAAIHGKNAAVRVEQVTKSGAGIARGPLNQADFLRQLEKSDYSRNVWERASLPLIALSLVLSLLLFARSRLPLLHTFSVMLCAAAGAAAFIAVPLPQYLTAKKLRKQGAALAGWSGCKAAGPRPNIIIGDLDVFPPGNFALSNEDGVWIADNTPKELVYGILAGVFSTTGNGLAPLFLRLCRITKNCPVLPPEEVKLQEGGGLFCRVNGDYVVIGSESFMTHMAKIEPPRHMKLQNAICVAINNEFTAVFNVKYRADKAVNNTLLGLLNGHTRPIFAVQDFNVTPAMLSHLFGIPVEKFSFPSFRERLRLSRLLANDNKTSVAVLTKKGLSSLARVAEGAHRLYISVLVNTWLSLGGALMLMLLLFRQMSAGGLSAVGPGRLLIFSLLCALPEVLISLWQNRN